MTHDYKSDRERLEAALDRRFSGSPAYEHAKAAAQLQAAAPALLKALEFYADEENYKSGAAMDNSIWVDNGKKARAAIAEAEGK